MALRVFVLDQVRVYRGGSVYGAATGPDTSPPRYMLNPVPHVALAPLAAVVRSPTLLVKRALTKPAAKAISTPEGVRARGALLEVGNRCGAGHGVDCRPFYPGSSGAPT